MRTSTKLATLTFALLPTAAMAHPAAYHALSLSSGVLHPLTGADHLLAMVAVGLLASQQKKVWLWPLAFMGAMLAGGILGMGGFALPLIEPAIAASLLVLGLLIATVTVLPAWAGFALVAVFGLFHGNAHGLEAPIDGSSLLYGMGFLAATGLLHALGVGLGLATMKISLPHVMRACGLLVAAAGGVFLLA